MTALTTFYNEQFKGKKAKFPHWFSDYQTLNFNRYLKQGLPERKTEQWQYVSLDKLKQFEFKSEPSNLLTDSTSEDIHITDGIITLPSVLPKGVTLMPLSVALTTHQAVCEALFSDKSHAQANCFEQINMGLLSEGIFIQVEKNAQIIAPLTININHTSANISHHSQCVYLIEENASINIVETFSGQASLNYFNNHLSHCCLKANAKATLVKIIEESDSATHISKTKVHQYRDSHFTHHSFALNGQMVRSDVEVDLIESGSHAVLNGLYLTTGTQNVSHFTRVNHLSPHAKSDEFYKGILADQSKGTFNGAVFVAKDAQKTSATQQNKNLLLSEKAQVNTKPQLEIYADDVKCAHGATIGQLDEDALFYMQSRGISKQEATTLLVNAFSNDLVEKLTADVFSVLKVKLHHQIEQYLRNSNAG